MQERQTKACRMYSQSSYGWVYMNVYLTPANKRLGFALCFDSKIPTQSLLVSQLTSYTAKVPKLVFFFFFTRQCFFISSFFFLYSCFPQFTFCFISILPRLPVNNPEELQSMAWKKIAEGSAEKSSQQPKKPVFSAGNRENISSSFNQSVTLTSITSCLLAEKVVPE